MKKEMRGLAAVCTYHALNDGGISVAPILLPIWKTAFGLSYTEIGIITGSALAVNLIAQLLIGRRSDHWDITIALPVGIFLVTLGILSLSLVNGFLSLLCGTLLLRIGASFFHPIGVAWISRLFRNGKRLDWAMGVQSGCADIGTFIAVISTLWIATNWGWQMPLYLWGSASLIGIVLGVYWTQDMRKKKSSISNNPVPFRTQLGQDIGFIKRISFITPALIVSGAAWGTTITFMPLLLDADLSIPLDQIGVLMSLWIGMGTIVSFSYGRICNWVGRYRLTLLSYLLLGLSMLSTLIISSIIGYAIILILIGIAAFITYPALSSYASGLGKKGRDGAEFAMVFTLQLGGGTIMLLINGWLSDTMGIHSPFIVIGMLSLVALSVLIYGKKSLSDTTNILVLGKKDDEIAK